MESDDTAPPAPEDYAKWRERNRADRYRMIDEYAAWLKPKGVLKVTPRKEAKAGRARSGPRR